MTMISAEIWPRLGSSECVRLWLSIVFGSCLHAAWVAAVVRFRQTKRTNQLSSCWQQQIPKLQLKNVKVKSLRPIGRRWSPFPKVLSQTPVFTLRDHDYAASVLCGVPVYIPAVKPVPNYTAWWQRHMCVNNLPKLRSLPGSVLVQSRTCPSWVTSGLQVRHITVRLLSHTELQLQCS